MENRSLSPDWCSRRGRRDVPCTTEANGLVVSPGKYSIRHRLSARMAVLGGFASALCLSASIQAGVVISEFRTRGPNGASDEFIELYNNSDSPADISGWKINGSSSTGTIATRLTVNTNTIIPARGHFLATNS